ncbi:MAG TPA: TadE family protein [Caulifigura sp.]|jgi:Flp pilus assembly protein TadG|nr:TadE family protein [Caulifigura sp.]
MNVRRPILKHSANRAGGVAVETAVVLPVLFMIMFGAVDCARLNMVRNTAQNAAYEGARNAITPGATANHAKAVAQKVLNGVGIKNYTVSVSPATITTATDVVTVTVTVPLKDNSWTAAASKTTRNMVRSCTMSVEKTKRS